MTLSSSGKLISMVASSIIVLIIIGVVLGIVLKKPEQVEQEEVIVIGGYVDGKGVISRSLDLGETWTNVTWPFSDENSSITSITHDGVVFLASTTSSYCTSQNGLTWSKEITVPDRYLSNVGEVNAVTSDGKGRVVLGCVNGIILKEVLKNGKDQWWSTDVKNGNATYAAFKGKTFAIASMGGLFLTKDFGENWTTIVQNYTFDVVYAGSDMWAAAIGTSGVEIVQNGKKRLLSLPGRTLALAVNKSTLLAGTDEGVFKLTPRRKPEPDNWEKVTNEPISNLEWTGKHFVGAFIDDETKTYSKLLFFDDNSATLLTEIEINPWPDGKSVHILALSGALVPKSTEKSTEKKPVAS